MASIFILKKPQELAAASLVEGEVPFKQLPKKLVEKVEKFTEKLDLEKQLEYLSVMIHLTSHFRDSDFATQGVALPKWVVDVFL